MDLVTVDLGKPVEFLAWTGIAMLDPSSGDFDEADTVYVDIWKVDGVRVDPTASGGVAGGRFLGPVGAPTNEQLPAGVLKGQRVTFRLRVFGDARVSAYGVAISPVP
jgi:hypothetical protein